VTGQLRTNLEAFLSTPTLLPERLQLSRIHFWLSRIVDEKALQLLVNTFESSFKVLLGILYETLVVPDAFRSDHGATTDRRLVSSTKTEIVAQ
jgi:hypothetical protein